jgi:aminoglycoside 6'-N-acetyltransferase I
MRVRPAIDADRLAWARMRHRLWDDFEPAELDSELEELAAIGTPYVAFIAEDGGAPVGFAELSVRSIAEGAALGPAAYLEGIWVETAFRRRGVARALLAAGEDWAREQGLSHIGSDALLDNEGSHRWHQAAGFGETVRLVVFGKSL